MNDELNEKVNEFAQKMKKGFNLKKAIKAFTIACGLLLIVFMTVVNITFDASKINLVDYLCNSLILVGIMIFGLVMGESVGEDKQLEKAGGLYQTNLNGYIEAHTAIEDIEIYFSQFFQWYKEKRAYLKRINYLIDNGIGHEWAKAIVDCLEPHDLNKLLSQSIAYEKDGKKIIVKRITEAQYPFVKNVMDGKLKLDVPSYSYYLSAQSKPNRKDILEQPSALEKDIKTNKRLNRAMKIVCSLVISFLWSTITVREFMQGEDGQAWLNLVSRVSAFVTSFASGWATSVIDVKIRAEMLENKATVLRYFRQCTDQGEFKPRTYEEEAQAIYAEEERAREEAVKNTIIPETIKAPDLEGIDMMDIKSTEIIDHKE